LLHFSLEKMSFLFDLNRIQWLDELKKEGKKI